MGEFPSKGARHCTRADVARTWVMMGARGGDGASKKQILTFYFLEKKYHNYKRGLKKI